MTDDPNDPSKGQGRQGFGAGANRRPAATIDLEATEIERRDVPDGDGSSAGSAAAGAPEAGRLGAAAADEAGTGATTRKAGTAAAQASASPRRGSRLGRFFTHLAAGAAGAVVAIFGADYAASTFNWQIPTTSAAQMEQLTRRIGAIEQDAKEHSGAIQMASLREQFESLKAALDKFGPAMGGIDTLAAQQKTLADRAAKLEQTLATGQAPGDLGSRMGKMEQQLKLLAEAGSAGQGGSVAQMASLLAKLESMGTTLEDHLSETRKSLQGDLQKQSAHFEDRLAEVDKGLSVETLKASGKTLSDQIVGLKAEGDKIRQDIAALGKGNDQLRQDLAGLTQATADMKAQMQAQASAFAKSDQLGALSAATAKLQSELAAITAKDQSREQSASRVLLALQLANLKRAVDHGGAFGKELAEVKRLAASGLDLSVLEPFADKGLPPSTALADQFKAITWNILSADQRAADDGSLLGSLLQGARSVVQVRKTGDVAGDETEAIVARAESRLQAGDLSGSLKEASALKGDARKAAEPWMAEVAARLSVDQTLANVEAGLVKTMAPSSTN